MEALRIFLTSIFSITALFISTKVIGNKQMSELNMFDYINGITIGSIAAEAAVDSENPFYLYLIALFVYTVIIWGSSFWGSKNIKVRRFFSGRSILLMNNGKIYHKNFTTAKIDINEFLSQARIAGYFSLNDIQTAVLEQSGSISFLPTAAARPVNTKDLNLAVTAAAPSGAVILNGEIMEANLKQIGKDEKWLLDKLHSLNIGNVKDVFYAECDGQDELLAYPHTEDAPKNDLFQ